MDIAGSSSTPPMGGVYELQAKAQFRPASKELRGRQYDGDDIDDDGAEFDAHDSTRHDKRDMQRLGRAQELKRNFRALSMLSFTIVVQATWEFVLVSVTQGLTDGGLAGMVWSMVWVFFGFAFIVASLAEMASMAPTSGGQYHWTSEFAPSKYQKFLSYLNGWQSTLAWQAGNASGPFVTGTVIQGLIYINNPNYDDAAWQATLIVIANILLVLVVNIWCIKWIPLAQNGLLVLHVFMFFAVIIPLWVLAPQASASDVFTSFSTSGGWTNTGVSILIGQISAIYGCIGSDAAAHMSEETTDAAVTVPRAMMHGYLLNGVMGIVLVITLCFALPDLDAALNDESGWPFLHAFTSAFSNGATSAITAGVLILIFASNVSYLASTGRETWSFARDNGLPFSGWLGKIHPKYQIPVNALVFSSIISVLLSLINIGSSTAFDAIVSLNSVAIVLTYTISIGCVLWRRIYHPETLPKARWSLGRWGILVNILGLGFSIWSFFWGFWPDYYPVTLENFNWSSVMFVGVTVISLLMYWFQGRHIYEGPMVLVEGRRMRSEEDQRRKD